MGSLKPGETFMIGEHEFIVLEQNYETTNVISKNLMAEGVRPFCILKSNILVLKGEK